MWRAILGRALVSVIIAFCLLYLGDYIVLRYRIARGGQAAGTDTLTVLYGTPLKNGQISIFTDQPQSQPCSRSIFPHLGYPACWYVRRHLTKIITEKSRPLSPAPDLRRLDPRDLGHARA
jgi:hypothetical protein